MGIWPRFGIINIYAWNVQRQHRSQIGFADDLFLMGTPLRTGKCALCMDNNTAHHGQSSAWNGTYRRIIEFFLFVFLSSTRILWQCDCCCGVCVRFRQKSLSLSFDETLSFCMISLCVRYSNYSFFFFSLSLILLRWKVCVCCCCTVSRTVGRTFVGL